MPSVDVRSVVPDRKSADFQSETTTVSSKPGLVDEDVHVYKCPGQGDIRSVCPALNTIANHSYLPHDGRHITFSALIHALHVAYGISVGFASFLVLGTYVLLRRSPLKPLDLHEISRHDRVEHNGSVTHDDADGAEYAPSQVDADLLHKFLTKAYSPSALHASEGEDIITIEDLAYTRVARQAASGPVDALHAEIARGEFAMVFNIFGKGTDKTLTKEDMEVWLKENRFPDGWSPNHMERLSETIAESKKMRDLVRRCQNGGGQEKNHGLWFSIEKAVEGLVHKVETAVHLHSADEVPNSKL